MVLPERCMCPRCKPKTCTRCSADDPMKRWRNSATEQTVRNCAPCGTTAAVIDASFTVEPGQIFVVMGLSGSGKSTLLRMLNGLLEPTAGHVRFDGQDLTALSPRDLRAVRSKKISMVFQHFALFPHRSVLENAAYGLEVQGVPRKEREQRAVEALRLAGLMRLGEVLARRALRRYAAARGPGPRTRHRRGPAPHGRVVQRARPADPPRHAGPAPRAPEDPEEDHRLHHPRPERGHAPGRPDRRHARRPHRPDRQRRGHPRHAYQRLRRLVHPGRGPLPRADRGRHHDRPREGVRPGRRAA